jgi:hypothetical protein
MARPYINTLNAVYSNPTFSIDLQYFHVRGGGTFTVYGISSSPISAFSATTSTYYSAGTTYSFNLGTLATASIGGVLIAGSSPSKYLYTGTVSYPFQGGYDSFTFSN